MTNQVFLKEVCYTFKRKFRGKLYEVRQGKMRSKKARQRKQETAPSEQRKMVSFYTII